MFEKVRREDYMGMIQWSRNMNKMYGIQVGFEK